MSIAKLRELGFADGLAYHLLNYDESSLLGFRCQPPSKWRMSPIAERRITAIWECGTTLVYFDNSAKLFGKCSIENIDETWGQYSSAQAILSDLIVELYEDGQTCDELRTVAGQLGFVHIERFLVEVEENSGPPYEEWRKRFPSTCNG